MPASSSRREAILSVEPGAHVRPGDAIARVPMESAKTKDITGGLPRVAELFEARRPKDHAVIAEMEGTIRFAVTKYKNKRRIIIEPHDSTLEPVEYLIPRASLYPSAGGVCQRREGDYIHDGNPAPHDILAIKGVEALASYLVNEIQEVYRLQGVVINDKHIEVIVRQMLQKVESQRAVDSTYNPADHVDRIELDEVNERLAGRKEASFRCAGLAWHHQGLAADAVVHISAAPSRKRPASSPRRPLRQDGHPAGPQGKRSLSAVSSRPVLAAR